MAKAQSGMEKTAASWKPVAIPPCWAPPLDFKMEGVTHNAEDKKAYVSDLPSRDRHAGYLLRSPEPHPPPRNDGGAVYELELRGWQKDTDGNWIWSGYVAKNMASIPELLRWLHRTRIGQRGRKVDSRDAEGNRCEQDKVAAVTTSSMRRIFAPCLSARTPADVTITTSGHLTSTPAGFPVSCLYRCTRRLRAAKVGDLNGYP